MTLTPRPGWVVVRRSQTAERYAGSSLIIPDTVRADVARNQWDIVALPAYGVRCEDYRPDLQCCDVAWKHLQHGTQWYHAIPTHLEPSSWVLLRPRSVFPVPGHRDLYLCPLDALLVVLLP
jgi:hypothetical protein